MALKSVRKTLKQAARMGKGRDNTIAHLASGEVVIPLDFQKKFPAVGAALRQSFEKAGLDYDQFVVGSPKNRINPRTGAPMFDEGGGGEGGGGEGGGGEGGGGEAGGSDDGGSDDGGSGSASAGEGAGADEGGGGFGGFGGGWGGYGDSGDAAGYSGEAGAAMGDAAAGAGYGSTGSTGDEGSAGATGDQGGGPAGGPSAGEMGGDPEPDIPAGDPTEFISQGQLNFNAFMDGLFGSVLSGTLTQDPTAEDIQGGFRGSSSPALSGATDVYTGLALSGPQAEAIAREDAINALREDVARNEEAAAALMNANQAAQEAAAAQAAAANQSVYGTLGNVGPSAWDTSTISSGYGATGVTGADIPGLGTSDYGVSGTTDSQVASTTSTDDRGGYTSDGTTSDEGVVSNVAQAETLSELPTTEIANAPSIFDLAALDNLAGKANEEDGFYSGQTMGGGDYFRRLTEEEQVVAAQLAQAGQQQASVAPTVTPVQYDISKFISGIGSLATSKQA